MKPGNMISHVCLAALLGAGLAAQVQAQTPVRTAAEMAAIGTDNESIDGTYILMNDLVLENWTPIGNDAWGFNGVFDGNGYTITLAGFNPSAGHTRIGLFGVIERRGVVKNLCITGHASYSCPRKILYIGAFAGVNNGLISCCVSRVTLEGGIELPEGKQTKTNCLFGYEAGAFGGCIAGINQGRITNCYSEGSVLVRGETMADYAGGIVGGNGQPVQGSIGVSIGPRGGGISATPGMATVSDVISHCYSTASVFSRVGEEGSASAVTITKSGGIAAHNHPTGRVTHCVALNRTIESSAKKGPQSAKQLIANQQLAYFAFYATDVPVSKLKNGQQEKPDNVSEKNAVDPASTQTESWWRYPDGFDEKQMRENFGFAFGGDERSPWVWDDEAKRPVLYWEKESGH